MVKSADELKLEWKLSDQQELDTAFTALLSTPAGRRFLRHLLTLCKVGQQPFTPNALTMSFNCGELNIGNQILAEIMSIDPDGYVRMQREATDEWRTREQALRDLDRTDIDESGQY
jgi:hypothetical protein